MKLYRIPVTGYERDFSEGFAIFDDPVLEIYILIREASLQIWKFMQ